MTDRAAALAYYGFLSLFPVLIVSVAVLALVGSYPETYNAIVDTLHDAAPGTVADLIDGALRDALQKRGQAGGLLGLALVLALISGSGATAAAIRALEAIEKQPGASGAARGWLTRLWLTLALMGLLMVGFVALLIAGPLFSSIAAAAGLESSARSLVSALRYPIGLLALFSAFLLLYWRGPSGAAAWARQLRPGRSARLRALGARLGGLLGLRLQLLVLRRDLRRARHGRSSCSSGYTSETWRSCSEASSTLSGCAVAMTPPLAVDLGRSIDRFLDAGEAFFSNLAAIDFAALAVALGFYLAHLLARSRAWQNVLRAAYPDARSPTRRITAAYLAGAGLNSFIPARRRRRGQDLPRQALDPAARPIRRSPPPSSSSRSSTRPSASWSCSTRSPRGCCRRRRSCPSCPPSRSPSGPRTRGC